MGRRTICLVIPSFLTGGMERVMSGIAEHFFKKGHDVHVVFLIQHDPFYIVNNEIRFHFPGFSYTRNFWSKVYFRIRIIFYLRRVIQRINPDTVLSIPQGYSNLTLLALAGTKIPVFVSDRNSPLRRGPMINRILKKILYPFASGIIAQTNTAKELLLKSGIFNRNIKVIPNPVKEIQFHPKLVEKKVILNVGRLVSGKNQKFLIEMFSELDNYEWELWIAGEGPSRIELENAIDELNLHDSVRLLGQIENVDQVMGQADIFAFTSLSEGYPNSLLEAKVYPLPCIAFDCIAGPAEIIRDNIDGFLIPMGDVDGFKKKMGLLMNDQELREKFKKGGGTTKFEHDFYKIGDQYLNFILSF